MDYPNYKVEYLPVRTQTKKWYESKEQTMPEHSAAVLEKLILEYDEAGYDLFSVVPMTDFTTIHSSFTGSYTKGFMVTFKKRH